MFLFFMDKYLGVGIAGLYNKCMFYLYKKLLKYFPKRLFHYTFISAVMTIVLHHCHHLVLSVFKILLIGIGVWSNGIAFHYDFNLHFPKCWVFFTYLFPINLFCGEVSAQVFCLFFKNWAIFLLLLCPRVLYTFWIILLWDVYFDSFFFEESEIVPFQFQTTIPCTYMLIKKTEKMNFQFTSTLVPLGKGPSSTQYLLKLTRRFAPPRWAPDHHWALKKATSGETAVL